MMNFIRCAAFALILSSGAGAAQDFNAGLDAYNAGDYATALREWRLLAEQGDALAQTALGFMYRDGLGVSQDSAEAVRWYRLSAEQGDAGAQTALGSMYELGRGVPQDFLQAYMWLNIAAANGHEIALEHRDRIASLISPADLSEAQRLARLCFNSGYQDCD